MNNRREKEREGDSHTIDFQEDIKEGYEEKRGKKKLSQVV